MVYGYSKLLFDNVVRRALPSLCKQQVVGIPLLQCVRPARATQGAAWLRFAFHHFNHSAPGAAKVDLFGANAGYAAGAQSRDFVFCG